MTNIIKYTLGIILIISGLIKLNDPLGFAYKLEEYYSADVLDIPILIKFALINGLVISLIEVILGIAIIVGKYIKQTLVISVMMFVFFGFLTFYSAYYNKVTDCGCFGDAIHFTPWQSFSKDMVLLVLTIILGFNYRKIKQKRFSTIYIIVGLLIAGSISIYSIYNIPIIDFRPYKIGNNIPELMEIPEDADKDVYEDKWFYKVNGTIKEFSTDDTPGNLKGAEFVNRETTLLSKGYTPPVHDFSLINNNTDYTYEILNKENILCIVSINLDFNNSTVINKINELIANEEDVIIISPSPDNIVDEFKAKINRDVKVYSIDNTTCKTIIRSNPGVIRLKKGIVTEKYTL